MSTLTQTEQTSPSTPSAGQQRSYPKVGGLYRQDSTGTEYKMLDTGAVDHSSALIFMAHFYGAL
jgi:hypothetical protein